MILQDDLSKSMQAMSSYLIKKTYIVRGKYTKTSKFKKRETNIKYKANYINIICRIINVRSKDLRSKSRTKKLVYARYICFNYLLESTNQSLTLIGDKFNRSSHSTVINGLKAHKNLIETKDKIYLEIFNSFEKYINQ